MTCDKCGAAKTGALYCANCRVIELTTRVKELEAMLSKNEGRVKEIVDESLLARATRAEGERDNQFKQNAEFIRLLDEARAELAALKRDGLGERVLAILTTGTISEIRRVTYEQESVTYVWCYQRDDSQRRKEVHAPTPHAALTALCDQLKGEGT